MSEIDLDIVKSEMTKADKAIVNACKSIQRHCIDDIEFLAKEEDMEGIIQRERQIAMLEREIYAASGIMSGIKYKDE